MDLQMIEKQIEELKDLSVDERIIAINRIVRKLKDVHPIQDPVSFVQWVKADDIEANDYNPNRVAPPEMKLLYDSIKEDGYTQPIVACWDGKRRKHVVVDGFHRNKTGKDHKDILGPRYGYLPTVPLEKDVADRMASTIRHNRARGSHDVELMSNIVAELVEMGKSDAWICKHLGMDIDEILRLKQITGLADLFKHKEFGMSWE